MLAAHSGRGGGTADTEHSKCSARKGVRARVPPPAPPTPQRRRRDMTAETEPQETQEGQRVLLAEDEALIRLDLAEMLTDAGYDVVGQASNGEEAVSLAESLRPDLIIMDVKMPVMDGLTAAETIGEQRICPVIMLTAFSQKELVERARDAGVMAYIVK